MNKELAINLLRGSVLGTNEQLHEAVFMAIKALKAEPTKRGRWLRKTEQLKDCTAYWYVCSECGERPLHGRLRADDALTNYCPNCGARMDEVEE